MRRDFLFCKAEKESGLTPADDENAAERKISRKDVAYLIGEQYYTSKHTYSMKWSAIELLTNLIGKSAVLHSFLKGMQNVSPRLSSHKQFFLRGF